MFEQRCAATAPRIIDQRRFTWRRGRQERRVRLSIYDNPLSDERRVEHADLEGLLIEISSQFLQLEARGLARGVHQALRNICNTAGTERGSFLEVAADGSTVTKAHHFSVNGDFPALPDFAGAPLRELLWLMGRLRNDEVVHIPNVADLPETARRERELLEKNGVCSVVCVPSYVGKRLRGIAAFSMTQRPASWQSDQLAVLEKGGRILGSAVHHLRTELDLEASREWLELTQRAGRSAAWEWHPQDDSLFFSSSTAEVFGVESALLPRTGSKLLEHIPPDDGKRIMRAFQKVFKTGEPYSIEHRFRIPGHGVVWAMVRGKPQFDNDGRVERVMGVSVDITERKRAELSLRHEKELAQVTLASIGDGVVRTDSHGCIDYLNPSAERLLGVTLPLVHGHPVAELYNAVEEDSGLPRSNVVEKCLATRRVVEPTESSLLLRSDGSKFSVRESAAPIIDLDGELIGAVLVFTNVSQLRSLQRRMVHLATHDPLTGLINRREFELRLTGAVNEAATTSRQFALCYLDLDEFKLVNDTCGHSAGDELLRQLTSVLGAVIPVNDTLARLGGDEFGILFADCTLDEARENAETVLDSIRQYRFLWEDRIFQVGASVGIVPVAGEDGNLAGLLSAADSACYVAKDRGRNQIHVSRPDDTEIAERKSEMQWVERINRALAEDRFRLFSQPIRPLQDPDEPEFHELLLRLVDVHGKIVRPSQFIAAAERYRMMPVIDQWVVGAGLDAISRLRKLHGDSVPVFTINLSGQSFGSGELGALILEKANRLDIAPSTVMFEITETAAIWNLSTALDFMQTLRDNGFRFVLDDFGSGLSSFRYLNSLAVDFLKIDGELVRNIPHDPIQREMVAAIHRIGDSMGIKTIGEWVEDEETAIVLREIGVDYAQGFGVGRPIPFDVE
jgi:diguanylate cyclase (GGDEF)-like protein/PAS domain S-box-containing protein